LFSRPSRTLSASFFGTDAIREFGWERDAVRPSTEPLSGVTALGKLRPAERTTEHTSPGFHRLGWGEQRCTRDPKASAACGTQNGFDGSGSPSNDLGSQWELGHESGFCGS